MRLRTPAATMRAVRFIFSEGSRKNEFTFWREAPSEQMYSASRHAMPLCSTEERQRSRNNLREVHLRWNPPTGPDDNWPDGPHYIQISILRHPFSRQRQSLPGGTSNSPEMSTAAFGLSLLAAQGCGRIDSNGSISWHPAGNHTDDCEDEGCHDEDEWIHGYPVCLSNSSHCEPSMPLWACVPCLKSALPAFHSCLTGCRGKARNADLCVPSGGRPAFPG